jgi:hypothetical protein
MLANTGDVCHDTNGAHIEISWAHKELYEV